MKNVLVICGGQSAEHEISILSARNILAALDKNCFQPIIIVISRTGCWNLITDKMLNEISVCEHTISDDLCTLIRISHKTLLMTLTGKQISIDVAFPLIHGPMGEDGTLQGLLEVMSIPYVGSGVLASAIGMDKDVLKKILASHGLPVVPMFTLHKQDSAPTFLQAKQSLNSNILFIKPAVMGSSVGVKKVSTADEYYKAIKEAFTYSSKVLIEKYIPCREIECGILGNFNPIASCLGEVVSHHEFNSYQAKYLDPTYIELVVPVDVSQLLAYEIKKMALRAYKAIDCKGLARVDFFISNDEKVYINELNTIPGFTSFSLYPRLWEASGISFTNLVSKLINFAYEHFDSKQEFVLSPLPLKLTHVNKMPIK